MTESSVDFKFLTKAQNLLQLQGALGGSRICAIEILAVGDWLDDPRGCIGRIQKRFGSEMIIVRSSATDEDTADASMAGAFDSCPNVDPTDPDAVENAIESVVHSYSEKAVDGFRNQEILIQPMVCDVTLSGVLFTRDLEHNLPYFVVNYEESDRTDSITAGTTSAPQRIFRVFKGVDSESLSAPLETMIVAAREIERVTGSSALDIEFAMDVHGHFFLLQVRPLVRTQIVSHAVLDRRLSDQVAAMKSLVEERFQRRSGLHGPTTALGEMPDWNPAEIIGTHPTHLATSLYRYLIMNSVWRDSRGFLGYLNPTPHQLLVTVAGRPYVDVRNSVNSFLPAALPPELAEKLVGHYIDRLHEHPEYHDKIEFEIVLSCHTFSIDSDQRRLMNAGFSDKEINELFACLFRLTDRIVLETARRSAQFDEDVDRLTARREALLAGGLRVEAIPFTVEQLLEDCRQSGTLPFSIAARCAFIAMSFLRSLVARGALTDEGYHAYTKSIDTVASELVRDLDRLRDSEISIEEFLKHYGHLRPGTYDVRAYSYSDRPGDYLTLSAAATRTGGSEESDSRNLEGSEGLSLGEVADRDAVKALIQEFGFSFTIDELDEFIKASVRQREWLKLEFTKNLSAALDLIARFGRHHGMSRDDVAFLGLEDLLRFANDSMSEADLALLKDGVDKRRKVYELTSCIPLPDLIFSAADVEVVSNQRRKPNFVTQRSIVADVVRLRDASEIPSDEELAGKIVLIENADPGYDWLFSKGIAGLCTKYGGAASHMTIRCAEFGTPAAIGCGEQIFENLVRASSVRLNCLQKIVEPHGT